MNNGAPTLVLNAVPDGVKTINGFLAVNSNDKKAIKEKKVNPIPQVSSLVSDLKFGDKIKLDFLYLGKTRWITGISKIKSSEKKKIQFKKIAVVYSADKKLAALKVSCGKYYLIFNIKTIMQYNKNNKPIAISDPDLLKRVNKLKTGQLITIDYETIDYRFIIKDFMIVPS